MTDDVSRQPSSQFAFIQPVIVRERVGLDAVSRENANCNNTALNYYSSVLITNLNPFASTNFRRCSVFGLVARLP